MGTKLVTNCNAHNAALGIPGLVEWNRTMERRRQPRFRRLGQRLTRLAAARAQSPVPPEHPLEASAHQVSLSAPFSRLVFLASVSDGPLNRT